MNMDINNSNQTNGAHSQNGIVCDVTNCTYNDHKTCTAKQIKVGPQYASSSADTVCVTFKC